jgi:hypothetical protein
MNFDEFFTLQTLYELVLVAIAAKVLQGVLNYLYRVWVYSKVPGPFNFPLFGNALQLLGEKSGGIWNYIFFKFPSL